MRPGCGRGRARQDGVTLVSWMVAQALGLLVLLALMTVWSSSRASHRHQQSLAAVQEAGRIALALMARDVRMAGFAGCGHTALLNHLSVPSARPPSPALFHDGIAIAATDHSPGTSDAITIIGGSPESTWLAAPMPDEQTLLLASAQVLGRLSPGDLLLLSDCVQTEVVRVQAVAGDMVTVATAHRRFAAGTEVMRYQQVQYRVEGGELRRNGTAIVSGAKDLQIQYGLAGPGQPVRRYVSDPAGATADVAAVRLALVLRDGEVVHPFAATVALRNRAR